MQFILLGRVVLKSDIDRHRQREGQGDFYKPPQHFVCMSIKNGCHLLELTEIQVYISLTSPSFR